MGELPRWDEPLGGHFVHGVGHSRCTDHRRLRPPRHLEPSAPSGHCPLRDLHVLRASTVDEVVAGILCRRPGLWVLLLHPLQRLELPLSRFRSDPTHCLLAPRRSFTPTTLATPGGGGIP